MNKKTGKIIYYVATGLLSALMLMSAFMYFYKHEMVSDTFAKLGYPIYIICPLALLKISGVIALWLKKCYALKEWAYAGFFFDIILALVAHLYVSDGGHATAIVALVLLTVSYVFKKNVREPAA